MQLGGEPIVVSMANCAPWNRGRPSATTSNRRLLAALGAAMSKSRTYWLTETRPPASRHTRASADYQPSPVRGSPASCCGFFSFATCFQLCFQPSPVRGSPATCCGVLFRLLALSLVGFLVWSFSEAFVRAFSGSCTEYLM